MSDSAKLYVNSTKWEMHDLYDLVVHHVKEICGGLEPIMVKFDETHPGQTMWLTYPLRKGPGMVMITKSHIGGFPAWLIDCSAKREARLNLLVKIGEKIGGIYMMNEANGVCEELRDEFMEDQDFTLKMIQKNASRFAQLKDLGKQELDNLLDNLKAMREKQYGKDETESANN